MSSGFRDLEVWVKSLVIATNDLFDSSCGIDSLINEHRLYRLAFQSGSHGDITSMVLGMVAMLVLIHLRYGDTNLWTQPEWEISKMGADGRLSIDGFLHSLAKRLNSGPVTIGEIVRWIYEDYVMLQHQLVATNKLPDNTFRFRRDGNQLSFYNLSNTLLFMNSRYESISTTIYELGFCKDMSQPDHPLTADGKKLLENGDL
jgi:hypothetical protein